MILEVMGRDAGWIALHAGVAGAADVILIPEIPYDLEKVAAGDSQARVAGRASSASSSSPKARKPDRRPASRFVEAARARLCRAARRRGHRDAPSSSRR